MEQLTTHKQLVQDVLQRNIRYGYLGSPASTPRCCGDFICSEADEKLFLFDTATCVVCNSA